MEIRRKEQNVRMVTKDTQLVENEKRLLREKLHDAEKAMTGAARYPGTVRWSSRNVQENISEFIYCLFREKETVLLYLKSVQKGLEENKSTMKQTRQGFYDLSKFLLSDAKLGTEGCPVGPMLLACQVGLHSDSFVFVLPLVLPVPLSDAIV